MKIDATDFKQDFANPISGRSVKNCLGYLAFHLLYICMKFKLPLLASTFFKRHPPFECQLEICAFQNFFRQIGCVKIVV